MIVHVQPKPVPSLSNRVSEAPRLTGPADAERHAGSRARQETRIPSIEIGRLVVESSTPIATAAIRDGFREVWLHHDHSVHSWSSDAFRDGLKIDLPPGVTGRELGRRLAQAILQRARVD